ncbi:MAG: PKD domain-containing protein [Nanoarchaeota archaeon]|nr:PKD domain-containing protein [Nanoarchaeota archaeon]
MNKIIGGVFVFLIIFLVFLSAIVNASISIDKNSSNIQQNYVGGDLIKGNVNISFSQQTNGVFSNNLGEQRMTLLDLLSNSSYKTIINYQCNPSNCKDGYTATGNAEDSWTSSLNGKEVYGFLLNGNNIQVKNFKINISGVPQSSCTNQIYIDLLNDNSIDFFNTNYISDGCGKKEGCFIDSGGTENVIISADKNYCEKISGLPPAPAYRLSAKVKKTGSVTAEIDLRIYNFTNSSNKQTFPKSCSIENAGDGEINCTIPYSSQKIFDALVCIKLKSNIDNAEYQIRGESSGDSCGGQGVPENGINIGSSDYELFIEPLKFAPVSKIEFSEATYKNLHDQSSALTKINDYLASTYKSNCTSGCVIPIGLSGIKQDITLDAANLVYDKGNLVSTSSIYRVAKSPFAIDSGYLMLNLEKMNIVVPEEDGIKDFNLFFDGERIFNGSISIKVGFYFNVNPLYVPIGQKLRFSASTIHNITSSSWNFGDGTAPVNSLGKEVDHAYLNPGLYTLEVTLLNSKGETSTKKFTVMTGNAKSSANLTLRKYETMIAQIRKDINNFSTPIKNELEKDLKINDLEDAVKKIRTEFDTPSINNSDAKYASIIQSLLALNLPLGVPSNISRTEYGELPLIAASSSIDTKYIEGISDKTVSDKNKLRNGILAWMNENYQGDIKFETISAVSENGKKDLIRVYNVFVTPKKQNDYDTYLIIGYPFDSLKFIQSGDEKILDQGSGAYIPLSGEASKSVSFFIISSNGVLPRAESLGIYVSPDTSHVFTEKPMCGEGGFICDEGGFKWGLFLILIGVLIIVLLVVYIILQEWYKKKYEKHLFKNPDDLYNIINFIYNSRLNESKDEDIKKKLAERKWSKEQIQYAFSKIDGRRTGMWEIPLFKAKENRKVQEELVKKNAGKPIDRRFLSQGSKEGF